MKNLLCSLFFLLAATGLAAQDFNHYEPMVCSGKIPEELLINSSRKYQEDLRKLSKKKLSKREKKGRKQFSLESNFVLDHMMQSGFVLFGDPVSQYTNEVAAKLIRGDQKLEKVRVYTLRSGAVNAFATDRGNVFVTLGLLAQLENEAQLAYVLAHELSHVESKHAVDMFLEAKDVERNMSRKNLLSKSTFDEQIVAKNRYSKELEMEADKKGLQRFLQTEYSTATLDVVFDVLKYAYLPFDEVKFERSFLEGDGYTLPDELWSKPVRAIEGEKENGDNAKSTHPSIGVRRQALADELAKTKRPEGKNYLVGEDRFQKIQQIARFELPQLYLHNDQAPEAVYVIWLLLQKEPNSVYLKKSLVKALYLYAKYRNNDDYTPEDLTATIEGESQRVYRLLNGIPKRELTVLALREAWKLHLEQAGDLEISSICSDLFIELATSHETLGDFKKTLTDTTGKTAPANTDEKPKSEPSKYDKIKEKNAPTGTPDGKSGAWKFAFVKFLEGEDFKQGFEKGRKEYERRKELEEYAETAKGRKQYRKDREHDRKKGQRLGIPSVVVINPFYLKLDARRKNALQYLQTESGQDNLRTLIEKIAPKSALKVKVLDVADLKEGQSDQFNEIRLLNDWFSEQVRYEDLSLTPGLSQDKINAIAEKYQTDYFLWTGVISLREAKKNAWVGVVLSCFYPVLLPFAVYKVARPEYDMLYYAILFDVKTGRRRTVKMEYFDKRDTDTVLKAHIFDTFVQISTK